MKEVFAREVIKGLRAFPKYLPSKYFYDAHGDKLFQKIMQLPEYYLTRTEFSILERFSNDLYKQFSANGTENFDLIELGAGDGTKTKLLLEKCLEENAEFTYYPVDISENVLKELSGNLNKQFPKLQVRPIPGEYFQAIRGINGGGRNKKVVLFLGSNIGNFNEDIIEKFLQELSDALRTGDLVLIGFDCKKDPHIIQKAYDDDAGVTKDFNLNLLERINRELSGNFNIDEFLHYALYNPEDGKAKSYLVSKKQQSVKIMEEEVLFEEWESIHVEISQKFDQQMINKLADKAGFEITKMYHDEKKYFVDALWRKK